MGVFLLGSSYLKRPVQSPTRTEKMAEDGKKRATSNVFAMFRQAQVQEFKEAFTMIDQNRDGVIDIEDLKDMYSNLGRIPPDEELKEMLKEAPGPLNFPFLCFSWLCVADG